MAWFRAQAIRKQLLGPAALGFAIAAISGCDLSSYSADLRYPPRTDPLYKDETVPGAEPIFPDRPGELPVLTLSQASVPSNPMEIAVKDNKLIDPKSLNPQLRGMLQTGLEQYFGTPAHPKVNGIGADVQQVLMLDEKTLEHGSRLYRINCLHCHGLPGDGRGPTAFWVNPHPRDYRQGTFKFVSTKPAGSATKPSRNDLLRTLREGIDGTSMPSFGLLLPGELDALVSYVIHLSLRGQVEVNFLRESLAGGEVTKVEEAVAAFSNYWLTAQSPDVVMQPPKYPYDGPDGEKEVKAAVLRGFHFFNDTQAGCVSCHTDFGRKSKFRYDQWGTLVRPANLTVATYRGGRRPIDLFWRVQGGIPGSGMAAFGESLEQEAKKFAASGGKEGRVKSVWDIIKFLEILPYPKMRQDLGVNID